MSSMFEDDVKDSDPIDVDDGWGTADDGAGIGDVDEDGWGDAAEGDEGDWGTASVDTEMIPSTSVSSPILTRQSSYLVLNHESLSEKQEALIKQTAEVLFVTNEDAGCLLRHYGWKSRKLQQEWFEDQATIRKTVGLTAEEDKKVPPRTSEGLIQCQSAYCDEVPPDQAHALNCGHVFCDDCWSNYLTSQISHGAASVFATCMGMQCNQDHIHKLGCQCKEMVPESLFAKYVKDEALLKKYKQWQLDSFVEGQRHIKWCPKPGCGLAVSYQSGGTKSIQCKCGHYFCYSCLQEAHTPSPCDLVQKWLQREKSDDATEIWLAAKTKECPKCQVRIEKNKACNHMTCIKCGHHFCIAGGTPVNLRSGLAVRIEDVAIGSNVLAYDEIDSIDSKSASGIVGRNVEAVLDRGVKSCVELLLADGRTLTCTPDHRIMTRKGWIEAGQLEIDRTQLAVGVEYPLHTDRAASDPIAASWSLSLPSLGGRLNVRPNGGVEMAMAFTRTLGYSMSTHALIEQSSLTTKLTMFHINDVEAALDDIELLTSKRPIIHHTRGISSYSIFLPSDLSLALYAVGVTSRASSVPTRFPSFLLEETCPIELAREFVGALFGGDGVTLHTNDGGNPTGLALLVRTTGAAASMQEHQLRCELIPLMERLGIESQHIQLSLRALDSSIATSLPIDYGTLSPDSLYDFVLTLSTAAILPFARVIGFRYSASKQVRLSIGAAFYRAIECVQKQRTELVQLVECIRANECDFDFNAAVAQAKSSMASTTTMHSDVLNWHPIDENELRSQPVDASITFADVEKSWCGNEMNWSTPTDSMVSSSTPLLPTFFVTLVGRRSVGLRPTYDLSVPSGKGDNFDSFTAGGIVVHNCWLCKEPWDKHGSSSGGYYTCLAYDASVKAGKISNEEKANIENQVLLQKYGYYYNRYKSSWDAIAMTRKLGERLEKSIKNQDFSKYAFVFEAIDKLMMARRVLQWTYALAYYFKSGKTKHLFEYQQDLLSNATEALQDIVDNTADLDKLLDSRKDIINKTSSIDKFRMEMVNQVERGDFEDLLLSQADAQIERWACANCKTDNPQKATHCTKPTCGACKRHGEPDCKSTICKPPQQPPAR